MQGRESASRVSSPPPTYIIDNSIHDNVGKGISLLNGADDGIAAPTITGTAPVAGTACANCEVDVYSDSGDEGKKYEGFAVAEGQATGHSRERQAVRTLRRRR